MYYVLLIYCYASLPSSSCRPAPAVHIWPNYAFLKYIWHNLKRLKGILLNPPWPLIVVNLFKIPRNIQISFDNMQYATLPSIHFLNIVSFIAYFRRIKKKTFFKDSKLYQFVWNHFYAWNNYEKVERSKNLVSIHVHFYHYNFK